MIASLLLELKVFLFIMSVLVLLVDILHVVAVWRLKNGKIIPSTNSFVVFGMALSYVITMLICGF